MKTAPLRRLLVTLALLPGLGACADGGASVTGASPQETATDAAIDVVATVYPLTAIARDIAPKARVTLLAAEGQDPHDLELTPADRTAVESADVLLYLGALGFQPQVEAAVAEAPGRVVAIADVVGPDALLAADGHDDDAAGRQTEAGVDPHLWLDAATMAAATEAVGEALAAADPSGAEGYRDRAATLRDELTALDAQLDRLLSGCARDTAIVSHEAYAYLLAPRGLSQEGISGSGGHTGASPRRLAELAERIRAEGIPAVLAEPVEGRDDAEALAREAGVELLEIDPLEVAEPSDGTVFMAKLRQQAETFASALGCA